MLTISCALKIGYYITRKKTASGLLDLLTIQCMWISLCTGWYTVDILVGHPDLPSRLGHPFPKLLGAWVVKISQLSAFMGDVLSQSKGHASSLGPRAACTNDCPRGGIKADAIPASRR